MADPGYPCNRHFVRLFEGNAVSVPVGADSHYQPDKALLEQYWADNTCAVLIASPSNPTGSLIPVEQLKEIHSLVQQRDAVLIVDEIYHGLTYEEQPRSALELGDSVFVINSFSKYFGMTGWRLGWIVAPEWAMDALDRLAQNLFLAAPTLSQHAALAAFRPETIEILEQRRAAFKERRDYLIPALRSLGFGIPEEPQGAFYIYANSTRFSNDSFEFCRQLLDEIGVAITPGKDFGTYGAADHVRFAYTSDLNNLEEGVRRLKDYLSV
jgi:aspartate/methionine/tyrosine aminotransferase